MYKLTPLAALIPMLFLSACGGNHTGTKAGQQDLTAGIKSVDEISFLETSQSGSYLKVFKDSAANTTVSLGNIVTSGSDGKLQLTETKRNVIKADTPNNYDAGLQGLNSKILPASYNQFNGVWGYEESQKNSIFFRSPDATGWQYQSIGHVYQGADELGFIVVGKPQDMSVLQANAKYTGIAMGSVASTSEIVALMNADLNIADKKLTVNITGSYIAPDNITNGFTTITPDTKYDLSEELSWQASNKEFKGAKMTARLYGNEGQEIGGIYKNTVDGKTVLGAFGGKKQ